MTTCVENQVVKINTPSALGFALAHNGGVQNVSVQVVNTNVEQTSKIEKSFLDVTKQLKTYFTRVNHVYFYPPERSIHDISSISNDDAISTFIDTMIFDIGVQS